MVNMRVLIINNSIRLVPLLKNLPTSNKESIGEWFYNRIKYIIFPIVYININIIVLQLRKNGLILYVLIYVTSKFPIYFCTINI